MEPNEKVKKLEEFVLTEGSRKNFQSVSVQINTLYIYSSYNYCLTFGHVVKSCHNSHRR